MNEESYQNLIHIMRNNFSSLISLLLIAFNLYDRVILAVDEQFFSACRSGDIAKVKDYLDSGVSASSKDAKGNTGNHDRP